MSRTEHAQKIQSVLRGYREARVVMTFAELGIGDALAGGAKTAEEIAADIGTDPSATRRFLRAAEAHGLVMRDGDHYRNTDLAAETMTTNGQTPLVNFARREASFYRRWEHLTDAVRTGRRPEENRRDEHGDDWVRNFTLALYDVARLNSDSVTDALSPVIQELDWPARVIDLGGGHGEYSLSLARRYSDLRAVVFDREPVAEVTREIVDASGLGDRVTVQAGDFHSDSLGDDYDVALLFGVLVGQDPERNIALLRRVRQSLKPGGYVIVRGHYVGRQAAETGNGSVLFDLHMLLSTDGGAAHGPDDISDWMRQSGIEPQPPIERDGPNAGTLLVGKIPVDAG